MCATEPSLGMAFKNTLAVMHALVDGRNMGVKGEVVRGQEAACITLAC